MTELLKTRTKTQLHTQTENLRAAMQGKVVSRGDDTYAETQHIWNAANEYEPELFVISETVEDIQGALRFVNNHNPLVSVRGGGDDRAGRALRHGGLVIGLSQWSEAESVLLAYVDAATSTLKNWARSLELLQHQMEIQCYF